MVVLHFYYKHYTITTEIKKQLVVVKWNFFDCFFFLWASSVFFISDILMNLFTKKKQS